MIVVPSDGGDMISEIIRDENPNHVEVKEPHT